MEILIYTISHSSLTIDKIFKERITITLITRMLRIIIIIITSLVVGVLIPSLILRTKTVVIIDKVEVLMGLGAEVAWMSSLPQTSQVMWVSMACTVSWALIFSQFCSLFATRSTLAARKSASLRECIPLLWGCSHSSLHPWLETIFSINALASVTLSEKNAPPAAASKWLLSNETEPW